VSRKQRKVDATDEVAIGDLSPELQEQFRRMLASPEHEAYLLQQAELDAARRDQLEADYQLHLRRERLRDAQEEECLVADERQVFGTGERNPTGRPVEITWQMVRDARALLRSEGEKGTQQQVAERIGCAVETVKRRTRENGGWSQA
jgi:hypothetical protein